MAALWVVCVVNDLVHSECNIWTTVVGKVHNEADGTLVVPVLNWKEVGLSVLIQRALALEKLYRRLATLGILP